MKKLKGIIVYGLIAVFCIVAAVGYIVSNKKGSSTAAGTGSKSDKEKQDHVKAVMKKSMETPAPNPTIGIGQGTDYAKTTSTAIENAGGLKEIIKKGDVVLIKPNICSSVGTEGGPIITDYRTVQEVARIAKELGASKVIVGEGPISGDAFEKASYISNKYDKIDGVEFVNFNRITQEDCYELKPEKSLAGKAILIPKVYMDADVVITVAKLKTHFQPEAVVSLSLKNSYGVPSAMIYGLGSKDGLHELGLKESIVDINRIRRPDFAVIEGIVGGEGNGPLNNRKVDSKVIFAGKDLVAIDTVAAAFMGFTVDQIPHLKLAADEKMGESKLDKITIKGADLNAIKMNFDSSFK